jgi:DNA-binding transcriptional MerR regulator
MDSKDKTYYIGDLATALGLSQRTIRYYEELGFIRPHRTDGGYRLYHDSDLNMLKLIMRFKDLGMSLEEISALLAPPAGRTGLSSVSALKSALEKRRGEFEQKMANYKDSIGQIDEILKLLTRCICCGTPVSDGPCSNCIMDGHDDAKMPIISRIIEGITR